MELLRSDRSVNNAVLSLRLHCVFVVPFVHKAEVLTEHAPCEQVIWAKLRVGRVAWWPGIVAQPVTLEQLAEAR